jgi:hypothetical protein
VATVLYVALTELKVRSFIADWPCPAGNCLPLDPAKPSTVALLAAGKIALAPDGAVDNTTPAGVVRGTPGLRSPGTVSN